MTEIVQKDHPILRDIAKEVPQDEITSKKIQSIISRMKKALATQEDGVAIAAPQIAEPLRIFVISGNIHGILHPHAEKTEKHEDIVFINPEIVKVSKDKKLVEEGCLSVRYLYGNIRRATKATVLAYNEKGEKFERGGSGLLAQIFQHEIDHLNGILFIDNAKDLRDVPPKKGKIKAEKVEK